MESYRLRSFLAVLGIVFSLVWVLPNIVNVENLKWWPVKNKLNYGLDIQGGVHLVMGVDVDGVVKETTLRLVNSLRAEFEKDGIANVDVTSPAPEQGEVTIKYNGAADHAKVDKILQDNHGTVLQVLSSNDTETSARYLDAYITDYKNKVITQAIETIRNRIDEFGVAEPSITQQGSNRILVQLPGMADAERAKELINTTAKLDFMIVDGGVSGDQLRTWITDAEKAGNYSMKTLKYSEYVSRLNEDLKGKLPAKEAVYFEKSPNAQKMEDGSTPMVLKTDTGLGGNDLDSAAVTYGQYGEPNVALRFNAAGANKFADITGNNVGHQMAIVLDKVVKSAPNLKERIGGGNAVITLGSTTDRQKTLGEAQMIATALRAGALPASLEQLEERRVGPTLGSDSVHKAKLGAYIGAAVVLLFMMLYYRTMGVIASLSLGVNILGVFALLSSFGATLTLPGIAGIALTVGFAVDANVLIQERIREELRHGASWKVAISQGYKLAMSAILDSNITTAATAIVLLYFGTGPVRGFAVTLLIGIVTTLFANVFVSKVLVDTLIHKLKVTKLAT